MNTERILNDEDALQLSATRIELKFLTAIENAKTKEDTREALQQYNVWVAARSIRIHGLPDSPVRKSGN